MSDHQIMDKALNQPSLLHNLFVLNVAGFSSLITTFSLLLVNIRSLHANTGSLQEVMKLGSEVAATDHYPILAFLNDDSKIMKTPIFCNNLRYLRNR